ncbi:hypothetical protein PFISCL1PPCAC_23907 [Pristionchus fissidentatus]|uniref:Peptidase M16 N-terminal domain-containing protein n=1 Tax=Pristionchus fissidentatus TaxID=1538716 RepID=A0AAV5WQ30_9BILA|nr:hypothetical protein PFISCL1PPCAC_23907 [Pristionchus fissidentatus]
MLSRISVRAQSSAAAASAPNTLASAFDLRSSRLTSGVSVSSVDLNQPIAHLAIAFRAGARHQSVTEAGFAHRLRNALGGDSRRAKGLTMLWQAGAIGANVHTTADRENIILSMSFPRSHASLGASLLSELAQPSLEAWELEDTLDTLKTDVAHLSTYEKVSQLLHEAAYRNGPLGQSPFTVNTGAVDFRKIQDYAASRLVASECAVVGVNVDHGELQSFFSERAFIQETKGRNQPAASAYHGHGESRREGCSSGVAVAVAGEAPSLGGDAKQLAAGAVAAAIAQKVLSSSSIFYQPYSDSGLLGFFVESKADGTTTERIKKAIIKFKTLDSAVDDASVKAAKAATKVAILAKADSGAELASSLASSVLSPSRDLHSPSDIVTLVDALSVNDVKEVARKAGARLSLGAIGSIRHVPYLDEC